MNLINQIIELMSSIRVVCFFLLLLLLVAPRHRSRLWLWLYRFSFTNSSGLTSCDLSVAAAAACLDSFIQEFRVVHSRDLLHLLTFIYDLPLSPSLSLSLTRCLCLCPTLELFSFIKTERRFFWRGGLRGGLLIQPHVTIGFVSQTRCNLKSTP